MKNYSEMLPHISGSDYETHFWNAIRGKKGQKEFMSKGMDTNTGAFTLTPNGQNKYMAAVKKEGLFRSLATDIRAYDQNYRIKTANGEDVAAWAPEGGTIHITDGMADFSDIALESISWRCSSSWKMRSSRMPPSISRTTSCPVWLRISAEPRTTASSTARV